MALTFTLLERLRVGRDGANHILTAEEFIQFAREASFAPCMIIAGLREGDHEDQIEIIVRFKHQRRDT